MTAAPRILELGSWHYVKDIHPDTTDVLWTGERPIPRGREGRGFADCTPWRFVQAMRAARSGRYDLVVVYMPLRPAWHPRYWLRAWLRQPLRPLAAMARVSGVAWLRLVKLPIPVAVLDMNDAFIVGAHNFFLFDKASVVFKRELPVDRWHILCHSAHPALPTRRIRRNKRWNARMAKVRPIALPAQPLDPAGGEHPDKETDVFFMGEVAENSWVRRAGLPEIKALRDAGLRVDIPDAWLPHDEFLKRMSRAWLAWSPSGYSWECYRTAEAAQCLTVPVVNYPTVERHAPLRDGEHVVFYEPLPGDLTATIHRALGDKDRLRQMAAAGRAHVRAHHLQEVLVNHVITTTLGRGGS